MIAIGCRSELAASIDKDGCLILHMDDHVNFVVFVDIAELEGYRGQISPGSEEVGAGITY